MAGEKEEFFYDFSRDLITEKKKLVSALRRNAISQKTIDDVVLEFEQTAAPVMIKIGILAQEKPEEGAGEEEEMESSVDIDLHKFNRADTIETVVEGIIRLAEDQSYHGRWFGFLADEELIELNLLPVDEDVEYWDGIQLLGYGKRYGVDKNTTLGEVVDKLPSSGAGGGGGPLF